MNSTFQEKIYEIAFGEDAINRGFSEDEVIAKIREFSDKSLLADDLEEKGE